jgi:DNA-binding PadR family transcriptional regulator
MHGWGVAQRIEQISGVFQIKLGSLYPALQRLASPAITA